MRVHEVCTAVALVTGLSLATHAQSTQPVLKLPNDIDFKAPVGPGTQNAVLYGDPTSTGIEADVRASPLRDNSPRWGAGDPIHQFEIIEHFPIAKIGNVEIAFTNSALFMLIAVAIIALLMIGATSRRAMVPGRFQASPIITASIRATGSGGNSGSAASSAFAVENSGAGECLPRTTPVTIGRTFTSASELVRALASLGFSQFRRGRYAAFRRVLVDSLGQVFRQS